MRTVLVLCLLYLSTCAYIVFDKDEWVRRMETVANKPSTYRNEYPWNVLYWDGSRWYADCNNLQKALFNGRDVYNPAPNSYQHDLSNTGDVTVEGLYNKCTSRSGDFTQLTNGQPRILFMSGHMGAYIGKEVQRPKGICNVIEATPAFEGGIIYSYVDSSGRRLDYKGGSQRGTWTGHGVPSLWVSF